MNRKGVSLSLETIVVLILAVLVLTVLLFFFSSQFYPAQNKIEDINLQRDLCWQYVNNDPQCKGVGGREIEPVKFDKISELKDVCSRLGYQKCNTANLPCIQECCAIFCTGTSQTCENKGGQCKTTGTCTTEVISGTCPSGQICCK